MARSSAALAVLLLAACGPADGGPDAGGLPRDASSPDAPRGPDAPPGPDAESCEPPDMLIVLDRTMSMHKRPDGSQPANNAAGYAESKWGIAIAALEQATAALDLTIRFGLELFPRDPGGDVCVTISERLAGMTATNPDCQQGEVVVPPALDTADTIASTLDVESTLLCTSTPIGAGLVVARDALAATQDPVRAQFALLLTDGQDTCDAALPLATVQAMAAAGVNTYVIGFGAEGVTDGIDRGALNDLACAGQTAPGFPAPCTMSGAGYVATDRTGPALYLAADDAASLTTALGAVAGEVCCNCVE